MRAIRNTQMELLIELEQYILEAESLDSPAQHILKRAHAEVLAIYTPLHKQAEDALE